jgi:hypothetical protein
MTEQGGIPEWLATAIVGAVLAMVGYFGRDVYERWKKRRESSLARRDQLEKLSALLEESRSIFESQNYQARRLLKLLEQNHPGQVMAERGFDENFHRLSDGFTPEERELHALIRSTSMNSLRRVNEAMSEWLRSNLWYKSGRYSQGPLAPLANQLRTLELHLNQWHDKYAAMIVPDPKRSLIYLADEKEHGVGFPPRIEDLVKGALTAEW